MLSAAAQPLNPVPGRINHRWFCSRFHFSTWLALLFSAGILFLVDVPGGRTGPGSYAHGWPFQVVKRDYFQDPQFRYVFGNSVIGQDNEREFPARAGITLAGADPAAINRVWRRDGLTAEFEEAIRPWSLDAVVESHPLAGLPDTLFVALILGTIGWLAQRRARRHNASGNWQFRLRTLLIAVAIAGVVCYKSASWYADYRAEQSALAELETYPGSATAIYYQRVWAAPAWLPECLLKIGDLGKTFERVDTVWFGTPFGAVRQSDGRLHGLAHLKHLRYLEFSDTDLSDAGARQLADLQSLESLAVRGSGVGISSRGLAALSKLRKLRSLLLEGIGVNEAAIEQLNGFQSLEELALLRTTSRIVHLHGLKKLKTFSIDCLCNPWGSPRPLYSVVPFLGFDRYIDTQDWLTNARQIFPPLCLLPPNACPCFQFPPLVPKDGIWRPEVRLDDLPKLEKCSLAGTTLTAASLRDVIRQPALRSLTLDVVRLEDGSPLVVQRHPNLETLVVVNSAFREIRIVDLPQLQSIVLAENTALAKLRLERVPTLRSLECAVGLLSPLVGNWERGRWQGSGLPPSWGRPGWLDLHGIANLSQLETLMLVGVRPTEETINEINHLENLRSLDVDHSFLTDSDLLILVGLARLEELDLSGTDVTGVGLKALKLMPRLTKLTLSAPPTVALKSLQASHPNLKVDPAGERWGGFVSGFPPDDRTTLPELLVKARDSGTRQIITTPQMNVVDADLNRIAEMNDVESLNLANAEITDRGLAQLQRLTNLKALDLSDTEITDDGLKSLAGMTRLESLALKNTFVTGKGLQHLRRLTALRALDLSNCEVDDGGLAKIKFFPNLKVLNLAENRFTEDGLTSLAGCTKLTKLNIAVEFNPDDWQVSPPPISDASLVHLRGMTNLETLCLSGCGITGPGLDHLRLLSKLADLDLSGNPLGLDGLQHLSKLRHLRRLNLDDVPAAAIGLAALAGTAGLEELELNGAVMPWSRLERLRRLPALKSLGISQSLYRQFVGEVPRDEWPEFGIGYDWSTSDDTWRSFFAMTPSTKDR